MSSVRTVTEKARQSLRVGERQFRPTPNVRNGMMMEEAEKFADVVRKFLMEITAYKHHLLGYLKTYPDILKGNLPRVWQVVEGGLVEPVRPSISHGQGAIFIGGDYDDQLLQEVVEVLDRKLEEDIIAPLHHWLESLEVVKSRLPKVERLRLELDARRRALLTQLQNTQMKAEEAMHAVMRYRSFVSTRRMLPVSRTAQSVRGAGDTSGAASVVSETFEGVHGPYGRWHRTPHADDKLIQAQRDAEEYTRKSLHKQRKLDAIHDSFEEQERLVWEQLSGLVRDAAWMKSYVVATFLVVKDCFQAALVAVGPCKQPLPGFTQEGETARNGKVMGTVALAAALPQRLQVGAKPMERPLDLGAELHSRRALANPLQLSARQDQEAEVLAMQRVPPVTRGEPEKLLSQVQEAAMGRPGAAVGLEPSGIMSEGGGPEQLMEQAPSSAPTSGTSTLMPFGGTALASAAAALAPSTVQGKSTGPEEVLLHVEPGQSAFVPEIMPPHIVPTDPIATTTDLMREAQPEGVATMGAPSGAGPGTMPMDTATQAGIFTGAHTGEPTGRSPGLSATGMPIYEMSTPEMTSAEVPRTGGAAHLFPSVENWLGLRGGSGAMLQQSTAVGAAEGTLGMEGRPELVSHRQAASVGADQSSGLFQGLFRSIHMTTQSASGVA